MPSPKTTEKETTKAPAKASSKTPAKSGTKTTKKSPAKPAVKKKTTKKPRDMTKVPVTTDNKATAELSAQLDKVPRDKTKKSATKSRQSIADRTVSVKTRGHFPVLRWVILLPLMLLALFFKYCVQGYSFSALVCAGLAGVILFYNLTFLWMRHHPRPAKAVRRIFSIILCIGLLIVGVTEFLVIQASFGSTDADFEYLVVLGAKVRADGPSLSLQNRINKAYDYLTANPDTIAIVTGGQGTDEPITEAHCMYTNLVEMGIDPNRIWIEDKATSTWENLHFTLNLIEEKTGARPAKIGVLSSEYHLFRASLFAKECGVEFAGIPARTTNPFLMVNYFMREVAGVWHYILLGGLYHD